MSILAGLTWLGSSGRGIPTTVIGKEAAAVRNAARVDDVAALHRRNRFSNPLTAVASVADGAAGPAFAASLQRLRPKRRAPCCCGCWGGISSFFCRARWSISYRASYPAIACDIRLMQQADVACNCRRNWLNTRWISENERGRRRRLPNNCSSKVHEALGAKAHHQVRVAYNCRGKWPNTR